MYILIIREVKIRALWGVPAEKVDVILGAYEKNKKLVKGRRLDKVEFLETVVEKVAAQIISGELSDPQAISYFTVATITALMAEPVAFLPINDTERKMLESIPLMAEYENVESTVGGKEFLQKVKELHNIEIGTSRALMVSLKRKKFIAIGGGVKGGGTKTTVTLLERGVRHLRKAS